MRLLFLSQSHLDMAETEVEVPGFVFVEGSGTGDVGFESDDAGVKINLKRNGLAVAVFRKNGVLYE